MATTVSDLIGYTGNAGLGFGANADVPVSATKDLDVVNRTGEQLMLQNMAQNKALFDQKVQDRNKLMQAIDSGDLKVGNLLEEDTPYVKEGLNKLDEAWAAMVKKGVNDIDSQLAYKKALRDAQDRVTQAQSRFVGDTEQRTQAASETLPRKREAMLKNLDTWKKKGFWGEVQPYQQTQDLDIAGSILNTAANVTEQFTDPNNPLIKGKRTVFDYDKTLDSNKNNFLNDVNKRYDQQQLLNAIQSLPPDQFDETLTSINNRIDEYNKQKGFTKGQQGYVDEVKVAVDPKTGKAMVQERLPDFAAKFTLANQKPFSQVETTFDKDRAAYELGKERNKIAGANAAANQLRARTYASLQQKKLSQMDEGEKMGNTIWSGWIDKITTYPKGNVGNDVVWAKDLPKGYTYIAGLNEKGQPIQLKPKKKGNVEYFETKYKGADGADIGKDFLKEKYDLYKESGGKGDYKKYLKDLIKNGVVNMEVAGENGTADFNTAFQTVRALSNKINSKDEEPVFGTESSESDNTNE